MHFATVFTGLLAVTVASVSALPVAYNGVVARDDHSHLALRELLNEVYARDLEARRGGAGGLGGGSSTTRPHLMTGIPDPGGLNGLPGHIM
ncbi:hypothetical protein EIP91_000475 [Steccherinum ochraceum]|uniref:Uncharacterized protein n=1 Tax=Steccherinum ochraceum TaxID=92696 RepID=A0A4R0RM97_9APHY|nr:hypothetical protein EIP91_000475 [Steccherinum ochraceum]